nr:unnamed protein product [Callosobruchus chinensis]
MNNWSSEEKACALTSMLRESAAAILENLSSSNPRDLDVQQTKSEQYEAALRKLNEKHDIEVAALKNKIKRLEDLDQLKKAESECAQVKDKNATLRHMISQLEAESAPKIKNDNTTAEAEKARIKEDKSKLRERLAQLEAENKKLKSDLSNALDNAKNSMADLMRAKDVDNKMEQLLANLSENAKLKNIITQLGGELSRFRKELESSFSHTKKVVSGVGSLQEENSKMEGRVAELQKVNAAGA